MNYNFIVIAFFIYLIGSIPFAFLITKLFGLGDIRYIGSGNIGATNVLRTGKKSLALLVLILDVLKGFLPTYFVIKFYSIYNYEDLLVYLLASMSIFGHIFPLWLKFKGGKGVATYIGFIFAINYIFGVSFIFLWLFLAFFKKYSSLASIFSLCMIPLISIFLDYKPSISVFFLTITIILILKHYSNIRRIIDGTELKIKF